MIGPRRKIAVSGGAGFIGSAVIRMLLRETDAAAINLDKLTYAANLAALEDAADSPRYRFERLDIRDRAALSRAFARHRPDGVIHLAAESHVDRSIDGPGEFIRTNVVGSFSMLEAALEHWRTLDAESRARFRFVHVSTDEVFGGGRRTPYRETDALAPLCVYGRSKAEGERALRTAQPEHVVICTSWLFSPHERNFVRTMLRLGRDNDELRVVADRHGCPTPAFDLAAAIVAIARRVAAGGAPCGVDHYCGAGATTWAKFAEAIFAAAAPRLGRRPRIVPIAADDYPAAARRPAYSVLECARIARVFKLRRPDWRGRLDATLADILGMDGAA